MVDITVVILVYNHEKYIKQAIESVLAQKTSYSLEILIGEDNSTDSSKEIVLEYQKAHPDLIKVFFPNINKKIYVNGHPTGRWNLINLLNHAQGKYVSILDGDDYWTDPLKIQKQVDFLEANPDFAFCYHHVQIIQEGNFTNQALDMKRDQPDISTIEDILKLRIWAHINSVLYRKQSLTEFPDWFIKCPSLDWAILAIVTGDKKVRYMSDSMSVYRQHAGGLWSSHTKVQNYLRIVRTAKILKKNLLKGKNRKYAYWPLSDNYREISKHFKSISYIKSAYYKMLSRLWSKRYELSVRIETLMRK